MQIRSVVIDLGKKTFHLVAPVASGDVIVKNKLSQKQLLEFTANMQTSLIATQLNMVGMNDSYRDGRTGYTNP